MADDCRSCKHYVKEYYGYDDEYSVDYCARNRFRFEGDYHKCEHYEPEPNGCYLTTACVLAKNLPDDCDELQTLRAFRDGYLSSTEEGIQDIEQYYNKAPGLVAILDSQQNREQIYDRIYAELVIPCVDFIKNGQNEEAHRLYRDYTLSLYSSYKVQ